MGEAPRQSRLLRRAARRVAEGTGRVVRLLRAAAHDRGREPSTSTTSRLSTCSPRRAARGARSTGRTCYWDAEAARTARRIRLIGTPPGTTTATRTSLAARPRVRKICRLAAIRVPSPACPGSSTWGSTGPSALTRQPARQSESSAAPRSRDQRGSQSQLRSPQARTQQGGRQHPEVGCTAWQCFSSSPHLTSEQAKTARQLLVAARLQPDAHGYLRAFWTTERRYLEPDASAWIPRPTAMSSAARNPLPNRRPHDDHYRGLRPSAPARTSGPWASSSSCARPTPAPTRSGSSSTTT